jgi:hypothetical protein
MATFFILSAGVSVWGTTRVVEAETLTEFRVRTWKRASALSRTSKYRNALSTDNDLWQSDYLK